MFCYLAKNRRCQERRYNKRCCKMGERGRRRERCPKHMFLAALRSVFKCVPKITFSKRKNAGTNTGSPRYSVVLVFDYSQTKKQRRTSNNKEKLIFSLFIDVFDFNFKKNVIPANYKRTYT